MNNMITDSRTDARFASARQYIPQEFHELQISTTSCGRSNLVNTFKNRGARNKLALQVHVEAIKGNHQGWSSPPSAYQVVLPNDDRIITGYGYDNDLVTLAKAHISGDTGVITMLRPSFELGDFANNTFSEVFNTEVRRDITSFPLTPERIGRYGLYDGLKFVYCPVHGVEALNARPDYRVSTDRKVSMPVRKELRAVADVVEGKGDLMRGMLNANDMPVYRTRDVIREKAIEYGATDSLARTIANANSLAYELSPRRIARIEHMEYNDIKDGQVMSVAEVSTAHEFMKAIDGNLDHPLLSLAMVPRKWGSQSLKLLDLAPMFIAARGGYNFKQLGE